ncbi:SAM-dependent methyltransferase [Streptomyces turgidiscabies]|uniref:SAM-dependent methyltransferase n=1 Tax=Streptomyces turgidiscabies TaxID=85558 RepID=UPI0038F77269
MDIKIDTSVPHSARIWNYWMGGKDNYPVDQEAGDAYAAIAPHVEIMARASRQYLIRTVTHLARDLGVRQFLDIGTGLPSYDNTHQVAQRIAPDARIVYVDNDPIVLSHANALLYSTPQGETDYIDADLHDPKEILREAACTLHFGRPVALMLMGILGHIEDFAEATAIVRQLLAPLPPGSYLVHYDGIDIDPGLVKAQAHYNNSGALPYVLRSREQLAAFYEGLELLEPRIVSCPLWRPDSGTSPERTYIYGGIGRKP